MVFHWLRVRHNGGNIKKINGNNNFLYATKQTSVYKLYIHQKFQILAKQNYVITITLDLH